MLLLTEVIEVTEDGSADTLESVYISDNVHSSEQNCRALQEFSSLQDLFCSQDIVPDESLDSGYKTPSLASLLIFFK